MKIAVVDEDPSVQESIGATARSRPWLKIASRHRSGRDALLRIPKVRPDVVVMEVNLPGVSGIRCTRRLRKRQCTMPIIMFTTSSDTCDLMGAILAGADGYVVKGDTSIDEPLAEVAAGGVPFSRTIRPVIRQVFRALGNASHPNGPLTEREQEVVAHLIDNRRDKEIACRLNLSLRTVETYVNHVLRKLGVRSRKEVRCALPEARDLLHEGEPLESEARR